jgi:Zn-dependent protease
VPKYRLYIPTLALLDMSEQPAPENRFRRPETLFGNKPVEKKSTIKKVLGPLAVAGLILAKFGSFLLPLVKVFQIAKIATLGSKFLITGGTMLLSIWFYAQRWGWKFAAGFVFSIFVHELGHVYMAWKKGVPISAPFFIPGFGAMIMQKRAAKTKWDEALIGIGGPIAGTVTGLVWLLIGILSNHPFFFALAYTTFFLNIFNLLPIMPLDGGWVVRAISPKLFVIGIAGMVWLFVAGYIHNPFILMIVLLSVPGMIHSFRTRKELESPEEASTSKKFLLGAGYLLLCIALLGLMEFSHLV